MKALGQILIGFLLLVGDGLSGLALNKSAADNCLPVQCLLNPCAAATCPGKPTAQCRQAKCECRAQFWEGSTDVSDQCTLNEPDVRTLTGNITANGHTFVKMCYYNARRTNYTKPDSPSIMNPGEIDPSLCTDVVWAHGYIDAVRKTVSACRVGDSHCRDLFRKFLRFRTEHPGLFFAMSIDGADVRGGGEKQQQQQQQQSHGHSQLDPMRTYVSVSQHPSDRDTFAANVVKYLTNLQMDGLVIDWEFPTKASNTDTMFVELLKRLHTKFAARNSGGQGMFLAVTLANLPWKIMVSYDVKQVHPHVDYLIVKGYDFHLQGSRRERLSFSSPLYSQSPENRIPSLSSTLQTYILIMGIPAQKIVVGLSWKATRYLLPPNNSSITMPGFPGELLTRHGPQLMLKDGFTYPEICILNAIEDAQVFYDQQQEAPYVTWVGLWFGYEDQRSIAQKLKYIGHLGVAGVMISDVGLDDFQGLLCKGGKFPLLNAVKEKAAELGLGRAYKDNGDNRVRWASWYGVTAPVATSLLAAFIRLWCY